MYFTNQKHYKNMNKPFFSIILPTYNRLYSLKNIFCPGLEKQMFSHYELIIVDDGSADGTEKYLESDVFRKDFLNCSKKVRYVKNKYNKGAPASRNRGATLATAEWLWIVEDDIQIDKDNFLEEAKNIILKLNSNIAVVSPKLQESLNHIGYYKNPKNNFVRLGILSGEIYMDPDQEYSGYVLSAHGCTFIKKNVFNKFQEDEKLFYGNTYRDESDLYFRISKAGYKIYYCGNVLKVTHRNDFAQYGGQKTIRTQNLLEKRIMTFKNHYLYLNKNYNFPQIRILFFIFIRGIRYFSNIKQLKFIRFFLSYIKL